MQVDVIYKDQVIGCGTFNATLPRKGDYFEINGNIFIVEAVKFVYRPYSTFGNLSAKLFLENVPDSIKRIYKIN